MAAKIRANAGPMDAKIRANAGPMDAEIQANARRMSEPYASDECNPSGNVNALMSPNPNQLCLIHSTLFKAIHS